jgi:hypothetical protein
MSSPSIETFFPSSSSQQQMRQANGRREQVGERTNCELDLRRSWTCRRKGSACRAGRVLARPPSRASQCLPQHGAVSTEYWERIWGSGGSWVSPAVVGRSRGFLRDVSWQVVRRGTATRKKDELAARLFSQSRSADCKLVTFLKPPLLAALSHFELFLSPLYFLGTYCRSILSAMWHSRAASLFHRVLLYHVL